MTRTIIVVTISLVVLVWLAWAFQRRLIYFPMGGTVPAPPALDAVDAITLRTADGLDLGAWFVRSSAPAPITVVVLNGNAGNRSYRLPFALALRRLGAAVLLFDYRGFGGNPGTPGHSGLVADAVAARQHLKGRADVDPARVVYFGESLGAAVAAELAALHPPAALILRSPFTTMAEVGGHHYPFLPVRWILRDRFSTIDFVKQVHAPTLVIAGDRDSVVPVGQSRRVFDAAAGPKELVVVPGADHNDETLFTGEAMMNAIERLLRRLQ